MKTEVRFINDLRDNKQENVNVDAGETTLFNQRYTGYVQWSSYFKRLKLSKYLFVWWSGGLATFHFVYLYLKSQ